jgi:hypothetical protein
VIVAGGRVTTGAAVPAVGDAAGAVVGEAGAAVAGDVAVTWTFGGVVAAVVAVAA